MAHWFHRNPLKATASVNYDLKGAASNGVTQKICGDLRQKRVKLLDLLANPNIEVETLETESNNYLSLLQGFLQAYDDKGGDSKLRHSVRYRWTNTLLGQTPTECYDAYFEVVSMGINLALWFTKHAAKIAGSKEEPTMEEAKEVHKCLRRAAGIFKEIKDSMLSRLLDTPEKGADTDPRVVEAYYHQSTAEAQEVTIARAIELKHNAGLISGLAYETAKMFADADHSLAALDAATVDKWRKYIQLKNAFYMSMAHSYHGDSLLTQDKCGEAIKCLHESVKYFEKAGSLGTEYSKTKGPGTTAKPQEHIFFRKLGPVVKRTLEKCERENGFIYHQKVPDALPDLELKATYGLASPEEFVMPPADPVWKSETYSAFNIAARVDPEDKKAGKAALKAEGDLPPVKEADIPQSNKDPKNNSGCVIS